MARDAREEMLEAAQAADEAAASRPLGEQLRLLQCWDCKTVQELPDYPREAPSRDDVTLHYLDRAHGGQTETPHHRILHRVEKRVWGDKKAARQIMAQMWETEKGFKPEVYMVKDTLKEDAVKCHQAHRRQVPCIDWKVDSKRLTAPTQGARERLARELPRSFGGDRDAIAKGAPTQHLCDWCPVAVAVEYAKRRARGEE